MTDLTEPAITLARDTRDKLEDTIVELDAEISQAGYVIKELDEKRERERDKHTFLYKKQAVVFQTHAKLDSLVRELKRPREGWPWLSDDEYRMKVEDMHDELQQIADCTVEP